ncbi:MAG: polysaccharide export protein [Desulfoplanes sp.]|nr:polysaccharide export protein [Desulfoplanes sp.]
MLKFLPALSGLFFLLVLCGCVSSGSTPVRVSYSESLAAMDSLGAEELEKIKAFKKQQEAQDDSGLQQEVQNARRMTPAEYLQTSEGKRAEQVEYLVGGNDVLSITVYEEEDLSLESIRVTSEGKINFPLVGELSVADRTTAQIERLISDRLTQEQYLIHPHVSVRVKDYLSKKVLILGAVKNPGSYPLQESERLLNVVSRAGGVDFAEGANRINLVRTAMVNGQEQKVVIDINLRRLLNGDDTTSNFLVHNKDVINIPKAEKIFIIGQVNTPGDYVLKDKDLSLMEAIGMAGGFTRIAAQNRVRVIRTENGVDSKYTVDVEAITDEGKKEFDLMLKPNDVIIVPESYF